MTNTHEEDARDESRLNTVLTANIRALEQKRSEKAAEASLQEKLADAITRFTGSMTFVYAHIVIVTGWVAVNLGFVGSVPPFDPTFVILATVASVEAIFLSTFVLISQNRAARLAEQQAQLALQTSLLAEHEITRLLSLTVAIAGKLEVRAAEQPDLKELQRDVSPETVLDEIDRESKAADT